MQLFMLYHSKLKQCQSKSLLRFIIINFFIYFVFSLIFEPVFAGRLAHIHYHDNRIDFLKVPLLHTLQVRFSDQEVIQHIQCGDLAAWSVDVPSTTPFLFYIKPMMPDSKTNLTVVTNLHQYYFTLSAEQSASSNSAYAVIYDYPTSHLNGADDKSLVLPHLMHPVNSAYYYHGDRSLLPLSIYDDGHFTYLRFKPDKMPAIFAVDNQDGSEELVNFHREQGWIVITRVSPQFTLRLGRQAVLSLFNRKLISSRSIV